MRCLRCPWRVVARSEHAIMSRRGIGAACFGNITSCPFGPYYVWGATARILLGLADRLQPVLIPDWLKRMVRSVRC